MKTFETEFTKPIVRIGRIGLLVTAAATFLPPLYLWLVEGIVPTGSIILGDLVTIASIFGVLYVIEPLSYYPVLGTAGTYLSYLSGNVGNVRIPALISAQKTLGVQPNTEKGEIISICAIIGSILTNTVMMILAAVIGQALLAVLPPFVTESFNLVLPAICGSVMANYIKSNKKEIVIALVIGLLLAWLMSFGLQQSLATLFAVFLNIGINVVLYLRKKKAAAAAAAAQAEAPEEAEA